MVCCFIFHLSSAPLFCCPMTLYRFNDSANVVKKEVGCKKKSGKMGQKDDFSIHWTIFSFIETR